ncbi:MAG: ribbon-helix-helix protein, CopG family [Bryobacterales bacterium]|nr:ribbon-helix-helix protein, CopG family [Bryobacterales bacterium]
MTLPPEDYDQLMRIAKGKRVSASWVVRDAVNRYLAADLPLFHQESVGKGVL